MRQMKHVLLALLVACAIPGCGPRRRVYVTTVINTTIFTVNVTNVTTNTTNVTVQVTGDPVPTPGTIPPGVTLVVPCRRDDPDEVEVVTHKGKTVYKRSDNYGGHLHTDADGKKHVDVNDD